MKKRVLSVLLILVLVMSQAFADGMTREEFYAQGIDSLYSTDEESLQAAVNFFDRAGSYSFAQFYSIYADVLLKVVQADANHSLLDESVFSLEVLKNKTAFLEDLSVREFYACDDIGSYIKARKLEYAGDIDGAIALYGNLAILDSMKRAISLKSGSMAQRYEDAMELYNAGSYVEAAKAFEALGDYQNSKQMREDAFSKHPHEWADATCETPKTCKVCGTTEGEAPGHVWADATCETAKTCKVCGQTEGKELGHSYTTVTCTEPPICVLCGQKNGSALGHEWTDGSCEQPRTCTRCGLTYGSALGHDYAPATCDSPKTCSRCGKKEGNKLGHDWTAATCTAPKTCTRCGKTEGAKLSHSWKAATCTAPKTCYICGLTSGSALGHDYAPATYEAPETCRRCGATRGEKLENKYQIGDYVTFGTYPQTTSGNDKTPIEWLVLDRKGDEYLLISKYALDCVKYNTVFTDVTWETCSLRTWLNNDFYNKAFNADEKQRIVLSKVTADKNPKYCTDPGNDTTGNVFLLSISEVEKYFKYDTSRMCAPTDYAVKNGARTNSDYTIDGRESCWWWLRSPGGDYAVFVNFDGSVYSYSYGINVSRFDFGVRPCVWVWLF